MNEAEHRFAFESLGAYALGAMPESERGRIAAHIETCPICAEDVEQLERGASRIVDSVPVIEPPPELRNRIMAVVEKEAALIRATRRSPQAPREHRRWFSANASLRWALGAAAALVIGIVVGAQVIGGSDSPTTRTLSASVGGSHGWVELTDGHAQLVVDGIAHPGAGRVYEMWVQHGNDAPRPASENLSEAVFVVRSGKVDIPAHLGEGDRVMVTNEPMGGVRKPTSAPVVITSRV